MTRPEADPAKVNRPRRCTECGGPGATLRRDDAADAEHWWHPECWAAFRAWLAARLPDATKPRKRKANK